MALHSKWYAELQLNTASSVSMFARPRVIDGDLIPCDSMDSVAVLNH
jgi:hypothetical protein